MLNLSKGEYLGLVSKTMAADGLIIGTTDYLSSQSHASLHAHENAHLSFVLKGTMVVGRKRHSRLESAVERFSFIRSGELHETHLRTSSGKNINLELEPSFLNKYDLQENDLEQLARAPGASLMMLRLYQGLDSAEPCFDGLIDSMILSLLANPSKCRSTGPPAWVVTLRGLLHDEWEKEFNLQHLSVRH